VDIKTYIESGILEAYLLGKLSNVEAQVVEMHLTMHEELRAESDKIAQCIEALDRKEAQTPPPSLRKKIEEALFQTNDKKILPNEPLRVNSNSPMAIALPPATPKISLGRAAVWAAFLVSVISNFVLLGQRNKINEQLAQNQAKTDSLLQYQHNLFAMAEEHKHSAEMLADTNISAVVLKTTIPGHPMAVTVYWNKQNGDAFIAVDKLPMPPKGMQYQVWVMQKGKMNNVGMLNNELIAGVGMDKLENKVIEAEAFAVSLQQVGGSVEPDMKNLYVMGKVNS
jgi:anti-sigma-K factor RskA